MRARTLHGQEDFRVAEYTCSARRGDPAFEERHSALNIALVRHGVFTYRTEDSRVVLGPGDLLLGNVSQSYECLHEHTDGDVCVCFEFSERAVHAVAESLNLRNPRVRPSQGLGRRELTLHVVRALQAPSMEEAALALLAKVLSEGVPEPTVAKTAARQRRIGDVLSFMDARFDDALGLGDFAKIAGMSPYHFIRVFRAYVGMTPHQYLTRLRLMRSAEALLATNAPITHLALASGFRDLSHFNHSFKEAFGQSPQQFRIARNPKSTGTKRDRMRSQD